MLFVLFAAMACQLVGTTKIGWLKNAKSNTYLSVYHRGVLRGKRVNGDDLTVDEIFVSAHVSTNETCNRWQLIKDESVTEKNVYRLKTLNTSPGNYVQACNCGLRDYNPILRAKESTFNEWETVVNKDGRYTFKNRGSGLYLALNQNHCQFQDFYSCAWFWCYYTCAYDEKMNVMVVSAEPDADEAQWIFEETSSQDSNGQETGC